jgi:hypothetical protein
MTDLPRILAACQFSPRSPSGASCGVAIEAYGGQHFTDEGRARDLAREAYLRLRGVRILRFWVVISRERTAPSPQPSPPVGERESCWTSQRSQRMTPSGSTERP